MLSCERTFPYPSYRERLVFTKKLLSRSINEYLKTELLRAYQRDASGGSQAKVAPAGECWSYVDSLYEECGFRTRSTFFLAFKKVEGLSPAQWLNSVKKHTDQ